MNLSEMLQDYLRRKEIKMPRNEDREVSRD